MTDRVQRPLSIRLPHSGLRIAESVHGPGFRMRHERHPFHELYVVRRGHVMLEDERANRPMRLEAGTVWPIPAGTTHRMEDSAESVLMLVCFGTNYLEAHPDRKCLWQAIVDRGARPVRPDTVQFTAIVDSLNRVLAEQWHPRTGAALLIAAEIDRVLVQLERMPPVHAPASARQRVENVAALLETQFFEPWDVDRAAERARLSRRRFTTLFREVTGETFNQRLNHLRLQHATALLRDGQHSIPGAALAAGIQDLSHFYRLFKKKTGSAPRAWLAGHARDRATD